MKKELKPVPRLEHATSQCGTMAKAHTLFRALICTAALLLLTLWSHFSSAQVMAIPEWGIDLKGYSIELSRSQDYGERYIQAGTVIPGSPSFDFAHVVVSDASGTPLYSRYIRESGGDLRPVDVCMISTTTAAIVCLYRAHPSGGAPFGQDEIRVYRVDAAGNVTSTYWRFHTETSNWNNLYPTHSLWLNNQLYICGYAGKATALPNSPDGTAADKISFILRYNPSTNTTVRRFWNTTGSATAPIYDYDMALRMRELSNGDIFICGQMNNSITYTPPGGSSPVTKWPSFGLGMRVDASTFASIYERRVTPTPPFGFPTNNDARGLYCIDAIEDAGGGIWLLLNDFYQTQTRFWALAYLGTGPNTLNTVPSNSLKYWLDFDYAWGNQLAWDGSDLIVIGQQLKNPIGCPPPNPVSSFKNVNPFLASYNVSANAVTGLSTSVNDWKLQSSLDGTFTSSADYLTLNGFTQDVGRLYTYTVPPNPSVQDWIVVSPVAFPSSSFPLPYLNYKFNRLDPAREENVCYTTSDEGPCQNGLVGYTATQGNAPTFTNVTPAFGNEGGNVTSGKFPWTGVKTCSGVNRPATVPSLAAEGAENGLLISPNPAEGVVFITMPDGNDATAVSVSIIDAMGREVAKQDFASRAAGSHALDVSQLSPGVYQVTLKSRGKIQRAPLTIL